ncbi:MAG: hypothetical protein K2W92_09360 [Alphaproteobacteria bacterium]|jgi:hypothetical protein|nr:hypothetical protein [Alphaproteobacteria bacterium]
MKELSTSELKKKRDICINKLKTTEFNVLRGSLIERYKRCGKPGCKCAKERGHGPKFYLSVSIPGRHPEMTYIPLEMKEKVEASLSTLHCIRQLLEEIGNINRELIKRKETF